MTAIDALVQLAAELPDVGQPTFPATCATFAGSVGILVGTARRLPWERTTRWAAQLAAAGYGIGLVVWLAAVAMDRL